MRQIPLSIFGRNMKSVVSEEKPTVETPKTEDPIVVPEPEPEPIVSEIQTEEIKEEVKTEEVVSDVQKEIPVTEEKPIEEEPLKEEPVPEPELHVEEAKAEGPETKVEEPEEKAEEQEEPKKKRTRKSTAEKASETNASMKMTGATKLMDAVALVVPEYEDPLYDEFMEHMNEALLRTIFDERADAGVIKVILSNLARCYDNATRKYADVSAKLETVANKSYGLIVRQTAANSIGVNDAERKRNGLHSPEVYKGTGGKTVNLFAVEAGLRKEATELQTIIKQIEFKKSAIIAYLTASKQDADV